MERVETVTILANITNYLAGMEAARVKTVQLTATTLNARQAFDQQNAAMTTVGRGLVTMGALAAVAIGIQIAKFAEFDKAISSVKAATQETSENMDLLRNAALEAGAATVFTATEAANAIEELGKAGLSTKDILEGGLYQSLNLAAAGALGIARAAEITAVTLSQYGLAGSEAARVSDTLAAGAGKALGSVDDLAQGLKFVGPVAASMGISLEETVGTMALFAQQGIIGEQAGTGFRGMLSSLTSPSQLARQELERLHIELYDITTGGFLGMENAAGQLREGLKDLTDEQRDASLGIIFGNNQVTAARVLYQAGAEGVAQWTNNVTDSGYAAKVAADRLDNLSGDVEKLGGAFDTWLIRSGSGANDVLRSFVQGLTGIVDVLGSMPQEVLDVSLLLGGVLTVVTLVGGGFLIAVPKIAAFRLAMTESKLSMSGLVTTGAAVSGVLVVLGAAFALIAARQADITATTQELQQSLNQATGAVTAYTRELVIKKLSETDAFAAAKDAGISQKELTDAVIAGGVALENVHKKLTGNNTLVSFFQEMKGSSEGLTSVGIRAGNASASLYDLDKALQGSRDSLQDQQAAASASATSSADAAEQYKSAADEAASLTQNILGLIDAVNKANSVGQDAVSTNAAYQQSLQDARDEVNAFVEANGVQANALDETTVVGAQNAAMLADVAAKSQAAAKAALEAGGGADSYRDSLNAGRQAIYDTAFALTGNAEAAQILTDKIYAMPSEKEIQILMDTLAAQREVDNFIVRNDGRTIRIYADGSVRFGNSDMVARASGGILPGTPSRSDNMIIRAASGEYVVNAAQTARNRPVLDYINAGGVIPGYATGGMIRPQYAASGGGTIVAASAPDFGPLLAALSKMMRRSEAPVEIADRSVSAIGREVASNTRQRDRQGGMTRG